MAKVGGLLPDEKDPRIPSPYLDIADRINDGRIAPQHRKLYDSTVSFEEYHYYAELTRAEQANNAAVAQAHKVPLLKVIFPSKSNKIELDSRLTELNTNVAGNRATVTDEEWVNASKALRNASSMAIFYLLTTDVLGPFGLPYAVATTGWGPSVALYTVFGVLAALSGSVLWLCFMGQFVIKQRSLLILILPQASTRINSQCKPMPILVSVSSAATQDISSLPSRLCSFS